MIRRLINRLFRDPAPQVRDGGYQPTRDPGPVPSSLVRRDMREGGITIPDPVPLVAIKDPWGAER